MIVGLMLNLFKIITMGLSITGATTGDMVLASVQTVTGAKTFNDATLVLNGATSGNTTLKANAVAGTGNVTLPASGILTNIGTSILLSRGLAMP